MSPQVIADAEELEHFAHELRALVAQLRQNTTRLQGQFSRLGETWRDQEQRKFAEAFEQTAKGLGTFLEASQTHVQFLGKKAALIEDYLKQR